MKSRRVLRYLCDHCSKGFWDKNKCLRHEPSQDPVYATLTGKRLTIECAYCGKVVIRMRVKEVCEP
jgi:DNA-directed RNA polymerase subunit RPC12/RpoP